MKVLLMHPDRDFGLGNPRPFNEAALRQDLELDTLFAAMAQGDRFLLDVAQQAVFSSLNDPAAIRYRQEVLADCLKWPEVVREIYRIPIRAIENKRSLWMGIFSRDPSTILSGARNLLAMFVGLLKELRRLADSHAPGFQSRGFQRFFTMVQHELDDGYFAEVVEHLEELRFSRGVWLSAELGRGNEGEGYILRRRKRDGRNWIRRALGGRSPVYTYTLHPRDDAGARALGGIRDRGLNLVANAVAQSADHIDAFLNTLRLELAFYVGCLNLAEQTAELGEPIAIPEAASAGEDRHSFTGLYDLCLALTMKRSVVANDLDADGKHLVMITGANQGGKSVFLRSIGLAQLMMQCGMFVPAKSFSASVCDGVFTHYKREEDPSMESGKFDEELKRMSEIVEHLTPHATVLLNESFAATNEREGSEIARQITGALLERRIKVFYVTHLYELANGFHEAGRGNALFLRAERRPDGERTFRMIPGRPLQTSHARDVYQQVFAGASGSHETESTGVQAGYAGERHSIELDDEDGKDRPAARNAGSRGAGERRG